MSNTEGQLSLLGDPTIAAEERALFGDKLRPARCEFDAEGDFVVGNVVSIERDVDLKTGFAPVDIVTFEAISGAWARRTKRPQMGGLYSWPVMHATARNQLADMDPEPTEGERIAVRRGRDFVSNQGESKGKTLTAWDIALPDRPTEQTETEEPPF